MYARKTGAVLSSVSGFVPINICQNKYKAFEFKEEELKEDWLMQCSLQNDTVDPYRTALCCGKYPYSPEPKSQFPHISILRPLCKMSIIISSYLLCCIDNYERRNINVGACRWNLWDPLLALDINSLERQWVKDIRNACFGATQHGFVSQLPHLQAECLWRSCLTSFGLIISIVNWK